MSEATDRAILLADVSESSQLFRDVGDARAVTLVGDCIDRMIAIAQDCQGRFVHSRGDDVLCVFDDPLHAREAAGQMLGACPQGRVAVHAGVHWGPVIQARDEVFGDAVNLTARLASLANSGEALMSANLVGLLPPPMRADLRTMDRMLLKGMAQPVEVFALLLPAQRTAGAVTYTGAQSQAPRVPPQRIKVRISHGTTSLDLREGNELVLGRSPECDLVLDDMWISRRHGVVILRRGLVEYRDVSSTGSYVRLDGGDAYFLHRQTVLLSSSGIISPGRAAHAADARLIDFSIRKVSD